MLNEWRGWCWLVGAVDKLGLRPGLLALLLTAAVAEVVGGGVAEVRGGAGGEVLFTLEGVRAMASLTEPRLLAARLAVCRRGPACECVV